MKRKKSFISLLFILLVITIFMMIKVEDNIRSEKVIVIDSTKVDLPLFPDYDENNIAYYANSSQNIFRVEGDYFQVYRSANTRSKQKEWQSIFLKGVNIGAALPGKFPSEFPTDFDLYMDWFVQIARMNSNVIRTYTILPPVFYEALAQYNLIYSDKPLYIIQGVWATVPLGHNYHNPEFIYDFKHEIKNVIDVINGNAALKESPGKASGVYISDVSEFTIGYILGREWEPQGVTYTNQNMKIDSFNGDFISLPNGTAMEAWLAEMMEYTIKYEAITYLEQRPVSFVNWLPLDPMHHDSEYIENEKVREYDNDLESIDFRKYYQTDLVKSGIFASYHAYPYYPDYVYLDKKYRTENNYLSYLKDLKNHCPDMPLVIAEYGVPSSRGNSHYTPYGFDQGGHNEQAQAEINKLLTENIWESNCAGAIMFEWIDEWFKFNWMVMDFEQPQHRRKYWHNKENPEQNFGIMAVENRTVDLDGKIDDWPETKSRIAAQADPSYFYLKYQLDNFDFDQNNLFIAIDTYDKNLGEFNLKKLNKAAKRGIEFLIEINSTEDAVILVDDEYSVYSDIYNDYIPVYASKANNDGRFVPQELIANRERETLLGEKFPKHLHNRSKLVYGRLTDDSNADWYYDAETKVLELRLPWHLLNVSDPSSQQVLNDLADTPDIETTNADFHIYSYITDSANSSEIQYTIPANEKAYRYKWKSWDEPEYSTRLKPQYYTLQKLYPKLEPKAVNNQEIKEDFFLTKWYKNAPGAISITFDDGSYSQYEYGFPVLKKYNLTADFGIVGTWTSHTPANFAEEGVFAIERLSWKELKELVNAGNEISSHGFFHEKLDPSKSEDETISMLKRNKELLESNLGITINTLHYPYSFTNDKLKKCVKESGFQFARSYDVNHQNRDNFYSLSCKAILNENNPTPNQFYDWIEDYRDEWLILMYHHIFPKGSKEDKLFDFHSVKNRYSLYPKSFDNQMRLVRNSDYWVAPTSIVGRYIQARNNAKLSIIQDRDSYIIELISELDLEVNDFPMTVAFRSDWKVAQIINSLSDGYYNPRDGLITIDMGINKKIIVKKIK
ncbi:MAG: polysaccharide deacetylase family protein [Candidatus Tenebribacter burtonii]|nr:polysaccharide deacetylase family protein [Candidatus Tenebribacter burtonii]